MFQLKKHKKPNLPQHSTLNNHPSNATTPSKDIQETDATGEEEFSNDEIFETAVQWTENERSEVKEFYGLNDFNFISWPETRLAKTTLDTRYKHNLSYENTSVDGLNHRQPTIADSTNLHYPVELNEDTDALGIKGSIYKYIKLKGSTEDDEVLDQVLLNSPKFNVKVYLSLVHSNTTWKELLQGRENLRVKYQENEKLLKSLVKENFDRFVNAKVTIDNVYQDMKKVIYSKPDYGLVKTFKMLESFKLEVEKLHGPLLLACDKEKQLEDLHL